MPSASGASDPSRPDPGSGRPSIDERAARRARLESSDRDRYESLLRHLQAGREIPIQPRPPRRFGLDIHPSAGKVLLLALIVVVAWMAAIAVTDWLRQGRVDTWAGPDTTVQSGLRLEGCPEIRFREDVYFPSWVRFEGKVFRWAGLLSPIGPNSIGESFVETGYTLGDLTLYRVANSPDGRAGRQIMLRQGESPAGAMYVKAACG